MPAKNYLRRFLGISSRFLKKIKYGGDFRVNGEDKKLSLTTLFPGDEVSYDVLEEEPSFQPEEMALQIVYEDNYLLVVDKPTGILVHPVGREQHGTLANGVAFYLGQKGGSKTFHPVHRLDRGTSGLVLIAKEPRIQYMLSSQGGKLFQREYIALTEKKPLPEKGVIDLPIGRVPESIIKHRVDRAGKRAVTRYETIRQGRVTMLRLSLETGRTHQIRVHLAHIGAPLLGDDLYGGNTDLIERPALHAVRISFIHPITKREIILTSKLPPDMINLCPQEERD